MSRPAIKAYLSTLLFFAASLVLLAVSAAAYALFYFSYIPHVDLSRPIHLQYADGPFPHSTTQLTPSSLASLQPYDVTIKIRLPRTPTNLAAGNFMLDLALLPPPPAPNPLASSLFSVSNNITPIAYSRRPAIMPYLSPMTSLTRTFLSLPLHTFLLRDIDAETMTISMFEQVTFGRGWRNLPELVKLEIQTQPQPQISTRGQANDHAPLPPSYVPLQIYSASVHFHARFRGLKWLVYNFRILSFLAFASAFYCVALLSTGFVWAVISYTSPLLFSSKNKSVDDVQQGRAFNQDGTAKNIKSIKRESINQNTTSVKREADDTEPKDEDNESSLSLSNISETASTFPTLRGQMPIRYPISPDLQTPSRSYSATGDDTEPVKEASSRGRHRETDPAEDADGDEDEGRSSVHQRRSYCGSELTNADILDRGRRWSRTIRQGHVFASGSDLEIRSGPGTIDSRGDGGFDSGIGTSLDERDDNTNNHSENRNDRLRGQDREQSRW